MSNTKGGVLYNLVKKSNPLKVVCYMDVLLKEARKLTLLLMSVHNKVKEILALSSESILKVRQYEKNLQHLNYNTIRFKPPCSP